MAYNDVYNNRSGSVSVSATTATIVMSMFGTAAKRGWVVGVRVMVGNTTAAAGNNLLFQLCRPANTPNASAQSSGSAHDFRSPSPICQLATAYTLAPTVGAILAEWEVPQSSGAMWTEFPPTGDEWMLPDIANNNANAGLHLFVTPSVATATPVLVNMVHGE